MVYQFTLGDDDVVIWKKKLSELTGSSVNAKYSVVDFDPDNHLYMKNDSRKLEYYARKSDKSKQNWGQLKLFSCLAEFLTWFYNPDEDFNPVCVYVGASPGNNIPLVFDMFPQFEWHLYDSRDFDKLLVKRSVETPAKVKLYQRYFEDSDVEMFKEMSKNHSIFFISDIRSLGFSANMNRVVIEDELFVWEDMKLQQKWVMDMKPKYSQLKFRPPYFDPVTVKYFGGDTFPYLKGRIFYQNYSKPTSTETRLVVMGNDLKIIDYSIENYERMVMYHNSIIREMEYMQFRSPASGKIINSPKTGIVPNWDTAKLLYLFYKYFDRIGITPTDEIILSAIGHVDKYLIERSDNGRGRGRGMKFLTTGSK